MDRCGGAKEKQTTRLMDSFLRVHECKLGTLLRPHTSHGTQTRIKVSFVRAGRSNDRLYSEWCTVSGA